MVFVLQAEARKTNTIYSSRFAKDLYPELFTTSRWLLCVVDSVLKSLQA